MRERPDSAKDRFPQQVGCGAERSPVLVGEIEADNLALSVPSQALGNFSAGVVDAVADGCNRYAAGVATRRDGRLLRWIGDEVSTAKQDRGNGEDNSRR